MQYYRKLKVNINEELYEFYEWENNDSIEVLNNVLMYKISFKKMMMVLDNKVKLINNGEERSQDILFTDGFNSVVVEFNDNGEEIGISKLLVSDDLDVMDIAYDMEEDEVELEIIKKREKMGLRQDEKVKRYLLIEYKSLLEKNDEEKLMFWYWERFGKSKENIEEIYTELVKDLDSNITYKHYKLYEMVLLSYKKALESA